MSIGPRPQYTRLRRRARRPIWQHRSPKAAPLRPLHERAPWLTPNGPRVLTPSLQARADSHAISRAIGRPIMDEADPWRAPDRLPRIDRALLAAAAYGNPLPEVNGSRAELPPLHAPNPAAGKRRWWGRRRSS